MKILLAVDGSAYSDFAMAELIKRPWPPDSEIKVITVAEMPIRAVMGQWAILPDERWGADLILMGSRGAGCLKSLIAGHDE